MRTLRSCGTWMATVVVATLLSAAPIARSQEAGVQRAPDGGTHDHVDGIFVTPIAGSAFTATVLIETTRVMEDGGTLTRHTYNQIARDSQGRVRLERRQMLPASSTSTEPRLLEVYLIDMAAGTRTECVTATRMCRVMTVRRRAAPTVQPAGPMSNRESLERLDLGHAQRSGFDTVGTRETVTVEPQVAGNDRVMVSRKDIWYSPQLQLNLSTTRYSPKSGTDVLTVGSMDQGEPAPALLAVPEGYRVVDERTPPATSPTATVR